MGISGEDARSQAKIRGHAKGRPSFLRQIVEPEQEEKLYQFLIFFKTKFLRVFLKFLRFVPEVI
jgi:hypothetical protein